MHWVDFGEPVGSEPGYRRPALVVSSDRFNRSRISAVIVTAVTSNLRIADAPGDVEVEAGAANLRKDCVVNVSQTMVVDRMRLTGLIGRLDMVAQRQVDDGLRLVLGLA
ncbi:MAG: type II toxin-antitoxin system PemK/MazF family toxin [Aeromicrobium sp.]